MPTSLVLALLLLAPVARADPGACATPLCSAAERVAVAGGLRDAVVERYVFLDVKGAMLAAAGRPALDVRAHLDACVEAERALPREDDPLRFYDRMRRCTSALEDGHLILTVPGRLPQVALGVGFRLGEDGRVLVANRSPGLLRRLETDGGVPDASALLAPGVEVLAVDGVPAALAVAELAGYVHGSSTAARLERAVDALGRRDFAYPRARAATLTLAVAGGRREVTLPWWVAPGAREDRLAGPWARAVGVATTDLLDWSGAPSWAWSDPAQGASRGDTVLEPDEARALQAYRGESGAVAVRLGTFSREGGRRACYAQLLTFHTQTLDGGGGARPYTAVLADFVRGCAGRGEDLVLDLRQNEGGYLSHSTALARALLPADAAVPQGALLLRASGRNEAVYAKRVPALAGARALLTGSRTDAEDVLAALRDTRERGEGFTPAFLDHARGEGAFGGRVVALVSPSCMSACDRLAAMLQDAGRAVLVGGPTEGAGGSQQEAQGLGARWVDSDERLALSIPNAAMGIVREPTPARTEPASSFFSSYALENRPVWPDVPYATSADDLAHANRGWRAAAEAALDGPEHEVAGQTPPPPAAAPKV